jgi:hypothetical protein
MLAKRFLHHSHTGKLKPHEHTSYTSLGVLLAIVGGLLVAFTASAATPYNGPESGSIGLSGIVPAKPPTTAATIEKPSNGQHFSATPVTISGKCPADTLVEIFKNDIFAGSTTCSSTGSYSVDIDLLIGENRLIARVYDALNQPGPDSNSVKVFYDAVPTQLGPLASFDFGATQLLINTDAVYRGVFPNQEMNMRIDLIGGRPPYAVNVQWGDSTNKVVPRGDNIGFTVSHTYKKPGIYQIGIQASDADGRVAFMTVAAIVNGQPDIVVAPVTQQKQNILLMLWPLYTAIVTAVISFWLGERREKHILKVHGLLAAK